MSKKLTKGEFIKKARDKHGDKYDYTNVEYDGALKKVCIICPKHGEFKQTPSGHLNGNGCPKCNGEANGERKRLSKEEFIKKADEVHKGKYDYSNVKYGNNKTKVCIICPEHGKFWQRPNSHLKGNGCPKCANEANGERCRLSKEEFIKRANEVHDNKYGYSKIEYKDANTNVCIICPEHGEFWQTPSNHTQGHGCPKCYADKTRERQTLSKEEFIKKANEKHHGKYDYTNVEYKNNTTKVCIICPNPEHGEFEQTPNNHLSGSGCPKCGNIVIGDSKRSSKEEFIKKANKKHHGKYNYDKVEYVNHATKVCIICPKHGEFWQIPKSHLNGNGCPKCNLSHLERSVMNYLDNVGIAYDYQKRFKWLGNQSLDFYLPDYNVGIECQGEQHFFPVEHFGGDKGFKNTLERDKRKKKLCEENGVKLLYFGNITNYDTFLGETVHDDVQYLIDYLNEHKIDIKYK